MSADSCSLLVAVATAVTIAPLVLRLAFCVFDLVERGHVSVAAQDFLPLSPLTHPQRPVLGRAVIFLPLPPLNPLPASLPGVMQHIRRARGSLDLLTARFKLHRAPGSSGATSLTLSLVVVGGEDKDGVKEPWTG